MQLLDYESYIFNEKYNENGTKYYELRKKYEMLRSMQLE